MLEPQITPPSLFFPCYAVFDILKLSFLFLVAFIFVSLLFLQHIRSFIYFVFIMLFAFQQIPPSQMPHS